MRTWAPLLILFCVLMSESKSKCIICNHLYGLTCSGSLGSEDSAPSCCCIELIGGGLLCCLLLPGYGGGGLSGKRSEFVEAVLIILRGDWFVVLDTGEFDPVSNDPVNQKRGGIQNNVLMLNCLGSLH